MIYRLLSILVVSILAFSGCRKECDCSDIQRIEYGTSFGECFGYCNRDIAITPDKILFTKSGWIDSLQTRQCSKEIPSKEFFAFTDKIDLNDFKKLKEVIGCPDCNDGGAEWIRIITSDSSKKVTFEYGNEPDALKSLIHILRDYLKGFENCN